MIRKAAHIVLTAWLWLLTIGLSINVHYSHHKLFDIGVFSEADKCCTTNCDCCTDIHMRFSLQDDYLTSASVQDVVAPQPVLSFQWAAAELFALPLWAVNVCRFADWYASPPPPLPVPDRAALQVFRC